ncbi:MAG: GGDEF domain-containing protein [Burkholderiales bacterium]
MKQTERTLLEQMRITEFEVEHRKALLGFTAADVDYLLKMRTVVRGSIDAVVTAFYERQAEIDDIALVIGDADTLRCFQIAQKRYVLQLFEGVYDIEYVNSRLRVGLILKRIGIDPKLYLAATKTLKTLLYQLMEEACLDTGVCTQTQRALDKLFYFDVTLVFETYVRSMINEIELGKDKVVRYAAALEQRVAERTAELERQSRIDPLTGLLNRRILADTMQREIRIAERDAKPLCLVYFDLDRFKEINDRYGHERGDDVLKSVGEALREVSRNVDLCFRLGGDEFCVILAGSTEDEARSVYCDRLLQIVAERLDGLSLSIGIAQTGPEEYGDPEDLIQRADKAMYSAKRRSREATMA